jgi:hypothetical protein
MLLGHRLLFQVPLVDLHQNAITSLLGVKNHNSPANLLDDGEGDGKLGKFGVSKSFSFFNGVD